MDLEIDNALAVYLEEIIYMETLKKYEPLYEDIANENLRELFTKLHSNITESFKSMNERLPTNVSGAHFWAEPSRTLLRCINIVDDLYYSLKDTEYAFKVDEYYIAVFEQCNTFLSSSGGSAIPKGMEKIQLYYKKKIFYLDQTIQVKSPQTNNARYTLKIHGEGSYALVFKYKDESYNTWFIVKRAKDNLTDKELERFKREFNTLKNLKSPYVIEVYNYDDEVNQYIMEYMDYTLADYVAKNNQILTFEERRRLVFQSLRGFEYIHSKGLLHRDISPNNILLKEFDDGTIIVKIADFGLVKREFSELTSVHTEFKGSFNDPVLQHIGFYNYEIKHEVYALTYLTYFIFTGRRTIRDTGNVLLDDLVKKGMNSDLSKRYKDISEFREDVMRIRTEG